MGCIQLSEKLVAENTYLEPTAIAVMKLVWLTNDILKIIDKKVHSFCLNFQYRWKKIFDSRF